MPATWRLEITIPKEPNVNGKELFEYMEKTIKSVVPNIDVRTTAISLSKTGFSDEPPVQATCPECGFVFYVEDKMEKEESPKTSYGCLYCDAFSSDLRVIHEHMKACPEREKVVRCLFQ